MGWRRRRSKPTTVPVIWAWVYRDDEGNGHVMMAETVERAHEMMPVAQSTANGTGKPIELCVYRRGAAIETLWPGGGDERA